MAFRATAFADDKRGDCHVFAVVVGATDTSGDVWGFRASTSRILLGFVTTKLPLRRVRSHHILDVGKNLIIGNLGQVLVYFGDDRHPR